MTCRDSIHVICPAFFKTERTYRGVVDLIHEPQRDLSFAMNVRRCVLEMAFSLFTPLVQTHMKVTTLLYFPPAVTTDMLPWFASSTVLQGRTRTSARTACIDLGFSTRRMDYGGSSGDLPHHNMISIASRDTTSSQECVLRLTLNPDEATRRASIRMLSVSSCRYVHPVSIYT